LGLKQVILVLVKYIGFEMDGKRTVTGPAGQNKKTGLQETGLSIAIEKTIWLS